MWLHSHTKLFQFSKEVIPALLRIISKVLEHLIFSKIISHVNLSSISPLLYQEKLYTSATVIILIDSIAQAMQYYLS